MRDPVHFSGRGIAAALPFAALGRPAVLAADHSDTALFALREPFQRALSDKAAANEAAILAEQAIAGALHCSPDSRAVAVALSASPDHAEIARKSGLDVAEARFDAATFAKLEVMARIAETPARTLEGLIFKASVAKQKDYVDYIDEQVASSIVDDLIAMAGGANA